MWEGSEASRAEDGDGQPPAEKAGDGVAEKAGHGKTEEHGALVGLHDTLRADDPGGDGHAEREAVT